MLARAVELLNENPKATVEFVFWLNPDYIGEYEARQQYFFQALEMFSDACKEKEMPYPQLGPAGEILADEAWWQRMQLTRKGWAAQQDDPLDMEYPTDEV